MKRAILVAVAFSVALAGCSAAAEPDAPSESDVDCTEWNAGNDDFRHAMETSWLRTHSETERISYQSDYVAYEIGSSIGIVTPTQQITGYSNFFDWACSDETGGVLLLVKTQLLTPKEELLCRDFLAADVEQQAFWEEAGQKANGDTFESGYPARACAMFPDAIFQGVLSNVPAYVEAMDGSTGEDGGPNGSLARQTYSATFDQGDGFSQTVSVSIGPAVLGVDSALVESEWRAVGGTGSNPCLDVSISSIDVIETEFAAYAYGTVTITNNVPDFPPRDKTYSFSRSILAQAAMGVQYSNGTSCESLNFVPVKPSWGETTIWGPVPIVVAIADVRSPDFPNGDPAVVSAHPLWIDTTLAVPLALYQP